MKLNRKSLLVACVLAAMSTSALAASTTTSTSTTTVTNHDTPTSTSTRVTREQHGASTSTTNISTTETSSTKSSGTTVSVGVGQLGDYVAVPIIGATQKLAPEAFKSLQANIDEATESNSAFIKLGQLAKVKQNGKWGLVGTNGQVLLDPQYKELDPSYAEDGTYFVKLKKTLEHIKVDGTVLSSGKDALDEQVKQIIDHHDETVNKNQNSLNHKETYASDSYTAVSVKGKWGFNDASGNTVIAPQFKEVYTKFSEDRAFVKDAKGKNVAIDGTGKTVFEAPSNDIDAYDDGLAEFRRHISKFNLGGLLSMAVGITLSNHGGIYYGDAWNPVYDGVKRGYINRDGKIVIDSKNDAVWPITAYGTLVKNQGLIGFVNREGNYIIQPGNYDLGEFSDLNGLLVFINKDNKKAGVFDVDTGKQVIPFTYDSIRFVSLTNMVVVSGDTKQLIDMTTGNVILTTSKDMGINKFSGPYTWVHKTSSDYKLIDDSGKVLFSDNTITSAMPVKHGFAPVKSQGKWGIVNLRGEWVVQPQYEDIEIL